MVGSYLDFTTVSVLEDFKTSLALHKTEIYKRKSWIYILLFNLFVKDGDLKKNSEFE